MKKFKMKKGEKKFKKSRRREFSYDVVRTRLYEKCLIPLKLAVLVLVV